MINWKLTEQQADQVLAALQYRPYIEVAGLIGVLMQQAQHQQQEAQQQVQPQQAGGALGAEQQQVNPNGNAQVRPVVNGLDRHA